MKISLLNKSKKLAAFTLVELIIVIAIITVLALIAVPSTITMIRSSRIEAANTVAEDLFRATQNFITDQQIKGKQLYQSSDRDGVFPVEEAAVDNTSRKIIFVAYGVDDLDYSDVLSSGAGGTIVGIGDEATEKMRKTEIMTGIRNYLGDTYKNEEFTWACSIDADTYTVEWVLYSEDQVDGAGDIATMIRNVYGSGASKNSLYVESFNVSGSIVSNFCQEVDMNKGYTKYNIGQYPIPFIR